MNQLGRVQAVGGVNDKIEGFYEVCRQRGLDGSHGVVIPRDNVKHLMLAEEVVESVREGGLFRISQHNTSTKRSRFSPANLPAIAAATTSFPRAPSIAKWRTS